MAWNDNIIPGKQTGQSVAITPPSPREGGTGEDDFGVFNKFIESHRGASSAEFRTMERL